MPHLTLQERQAVRRFKSSLESLCPNAVESVLLFGSKARGDDRPDSDVDVLVVLSGKTPWMLRRAILRLATDIFLDTTVYISPKVYSRDKLTEMRRRHTAFLQAVESDAIAL